MHGLLALGVALLVIASAKGDSDYEDFGFEVKNRAKLDEWKNSVYIPNPKSAIQSNGSVSRWSFYARRTGLIYLQIFRRNSKYSLRYKLIGQEKVTITRTGVQTISPSSRIRVQAGDLVGFYFPYSSIIPFDGTECYSRRGYYYKKYTSYPLRSGNTYSFRSMQSRWKPCRYYSLKVRITKDAAKTQSAVAQYQFGHEAKDRTYLDKWSNAMYIPNPTQPIPNNGSVINWKFYARKAGLIYFQIWRKVTTNRYQFISQTPYKVETSGVQIVRPHHHMAVRKGDVIGFYFPGNSIIPFDGSECYTRRTLYVKSPIASRLKPGAIHYFSTKRGGWNPCRAYSLQVRIALVNDSIEEVGHQTIARDDLDGWRSSMYIPEPFNPLDPGHLFGWRIYAQRSGEIILQVWRPTGSSYRYKLVGQTEYEADKAGIHEISLNSEIEVEDGDVIGFFFPGQSIIPFDGSECYSRRTLYVKNPSRSSVKVGAYYTFRKKISGWNPCRNYSIVAQIRTPIETDTGSGSGDDGESGDGSGETTTTVPTRPANYKEHGYEVKNRRYIDSWSNAVYIPSPRNPIQSNGSVARWSFYARRTGLIYLQIWRKSSYRYKLIGQQRLDVTRTGIQNVNATSRIGVQRGDLLGFYFPGNSIIPFDGTECYTNRGYYMKKYFRSPLVIGRTYSFSIQQSGWDPCRQYSLKIGIYLGGGYQITNVTQRPTAEPTYPETTVNATTESYGATTEASEATTNKSGNGTCCWKKYPGKALIGEVLSVLPEPVDQCKKQCCINKECLSFSSSEFSGQIFCVLQSSTITSDSLVKNDPKFNHYDRANC